MSEGRGGEFSHLHCQAHRRHYRTLPGRIFDPACGSSGMFVQSARFVNEHRENGGNTISIYGQERVSETVRLAKMNLAVHGLGGDIRQGNTYYETCITAPSEAASSISSWPIPPST